MKSDIKVHDYSTTICVICGHKVPTCENGTTSIIRAGRYLCDHQLGAEILSAYESLNRGIVAPDKPTQDGLIRESETNARAQRLQRIFKGEQQ